MHKEIQRKSPYVFLYALYISAKYIGLAKCALIVRT